MNIVIESRREPSRIIKKKKKKKEPPQKEKKKVDQKKKLINVQLPVIEIPGTKATHYLDSN